VTSVYTIEGVLSSVFDEIFQKTYDGVVHAVVAQVVVSGTVKSNAIIGDTHSHPATRDIVTIVVLIVVAVVANPNGSLLVRHYASTLSSTIQNVAKSSGTEICLRNPSSS
jgi:hypothetical protein